ncbi:fascin domain-containing protein [Burkholderia lata]|uniref:Uncharacterized protein n=1 Tax=Burkholderia lata (strain ATCC 17760 / DSM 23089 / LMG 22485 / NCIMB 9086 / R18194 / 383) TaxID=482957 RepID=Q39K70_BURL3|nr:hypothetical protein [Burkholderia lata]ABB07146.1 hypothetical protein Bcep18194_A3544 [Burkholderia lata]
MTTLNPGTYQFQAIDTEYWSPIQYGSNDPLYVIAGKWVADDWCNFFVKKHAENSVTIQDKLGHYLSLIQYSTGGPYYLVASQKNHVDNWCIFYVSDGTVPNTINFQVHGNDNVYYLTVINADSRNYIEATNDSDPAWRNFSVTLINSD